MKKLLENMRTKAAGCYVYAAMLAKKTEGEMSAAIHFTSNSLQCTCKCGEPVSYYFKEARALHVHVREAA